MNTLDADRRTAAFIVAAIALWRTHGLQFALHYLEECGIDEKRMDELLRIALLRIWQ
jgi:hypothetical protein